MTDTIYSQNNIDPNKLSRDYINNPLNKKIPMNTGGFRMELPNPEDLIYLYIKLNLSYKRMSAVFSVSIDSITKWIKSYNIKKSKQQISNNIIKTKLERYGRSNVGQFGSHEHKKAIQEKYRTDFYTKTDDFKVKVKQTKLERYGDENYNNIEKQHIYWDNLTKYEKSMNRQKRNKTCLERYGDENYNNIEKYKETCLERYGKENFSQSDEYKEVMLKKFGVEHYSQSNEFKNLFNNNAFVKNIQQKISETKKKNNSFTKSKPEDDYYQKLCEEYGENNVIRQYRSELYPFNCDFYIPSENLYIEYNGSWTHGPEPYDPTNKEHRLLLEKWKQKEKESDNIKLGKKSYYTHAIKYWTVSDPLKRETVQKNGLNFIEVW